MKTTKYTHPALTDENDKPVYLLVPVRKAVCPRCGGHGTHERQDIDMSRVVDSMNEDGDVDGLESYYKGKFDVICTECHGNNVVDEIDQEYMESNYPEECKQIREYERDAYEDRKYAEAERRACGFC
jgi:hypothetical protein